MFMHASSHISQKDEHLPCADNEADRPGTATASVELMVYTSTQTKKKETQNYHLKCQVPGRKKDGIL